MRKIFFFLTFILGIYQSRGQTEPGKNIVGKWILVAETDSFPDDIEPLREVDSISDSDTKMDLKTYLTFNKDRSILVNQMGNEYTTDYRLKDSTLTLGNRVYLILKLDKEELIYKERDDWFDKHYHYKKME